MPGEFERPGRDIETVSDLQGAGTGPRERAKAASRDLLDRAVEKKDELKQRASTVADERRTGVAERASSISRALHGAADTLRENGEPQLSDWVHQAAGQVERVVGYLEGKRVDGMAHDLEGLARSNPALFLGGTYVAGLALGRFLRATSPEHRQERALRDGIDSESSGFEESTRYPAAGEYAGTGAEGLESVTGNLGSTGWSGVGMAPGAFGTPGAAEEASPSRIDHGERDRDREV